MFEKEISEITKSIKIENDKSLIFKLKMDDNAYTLGYDQNNQCYFIYGKNCIDKYINIQKQVWYNLDNNIVSKLTYKFFKDKFDSLFLQEFIEKPENVKINAQNISKYFNSLKQEEFIVVTKIYGINVNHNNTCIKLGNYLLCDYEYFQTTYKPNHFSREILNSKFDEQPSGAIDNCYIINEKILAINYNIAVELFYKEVETFINLVIFCIGWCSEDNAKISCFDTNIHSDHIVINQLNHNVNFCMSNNSLMNPSYYLDEEFFKRNNYEILFDLLCKDNLTQIENKILVSVDWIGQSMRTNNLTQRYTFLCIALESLLSNKNSGLMEQSITSRLREYSSFLATDDKGKRYDIYKELPGLYKKRSEISHTGKSSGLAIKDYYKLLEILYPIVKKMLSMRGNIKTQKDLDEYILKQKNIMND